MALTLRKIDADLAGCPEPAVFAAECDFEMDRLSARELECARLVAKGYSNKEVALLLGISHWTVAAHLKATFLKLGVGRRVELAYLMRRLI